MINNIPKGWSYKKLNELGFIGRGKSKHRPRNAPSLYVGSYPFIQTGDVKAANLYITEYSQTYNDVGLAQSKLWNPGTLCITIAANIAETALLKITACFPDSIVGFVADPDKADVKFIKYQIDMIKLKMQNISKGTTQDNLSLDKLMSFDFLLPSIHTQKKIASILSTYDDLVENNNRRIKILEEMAQAIYREWFVNFRFPGHQKVKMVKSELGMIPEGWDVKKLEEVIELAYGKALKKDDRTDGDIPVYGSGGICGTHNKSLIEGPGIIVGRKGNVGSVFWSEKCFYPIDTVYYVKSSTQLHYIYFNLLEQQFINTDAAVPGLSRNQAYKNKFLLPAGNILELFTSIIKPIFNQSELLINKNNNLHKTRDLLLPKLINGEINVENIEIETEEREGVL